MNHPTKWALGVALSLTLILTGTGAAGVGVSAAAEKSPASEIKKVDDAVRVLEEMMKESDKGIPMELFEKCAGIDILPNVIKAAYIVGGRHGNGVSDFPSAVLQLNPRRFSFGDKSHFDLGRTFPGAVLPREHDSIRRIARRNFPDVVLLAIGEALVEPSSLALLEIHLLGALPPEGKPLL